MKRLWRHQFRRTTLWLLLALAVLAGIGGTRADWHTSEQLTWLLGGLVLAAFRWRYWTSALVVIAFGLSLGVGRGQLYMKKLQVYQPYHYHKVTLIARARDDAVYGKNSQLSFEAGEVRLADGQRLAGKIALSGFGPNAIYQGDEMAGSGKLYPGFGAYQASMSFAQLQLIGRHPSVIADIRRTFTAGMQSALPEPLASFAMGLLIGQRATLPADVKQALLRVGLTHIIAVSGYNLTIILRASRRLLARYSKHLSTLLSLALIGVFLLLAGASASIVRAAIISSLSIWASYYGRVFRPLNLIALAAAVTAFMNPFYLWSDISWYLSFLAFYGVMVIGPLIEVRLRPRLQRSVVVQVALESVCAELMTLPIILFIFGQLSFVGLLANVLVVALIPLGMLLSAIAGLAGMLTDPIVGWLAWPARLLLTYMLDVAQLLSRLPHSFVQHLSISLSQMLFLYGLTLLFNASLWFKNKSKSGTITDRDEANEMGALP